MSNLGAFVRSETPFTHWRAKKFLSREVVKEINVQWPESDYPGWRTENSRISKKSALMFPARLPPAAHALATSMMAPDTVAQLSEITGQELLPDPWFTEGPEIPRVGGGLHEIHVGGLLGMHLDFSHHPTGLTRCLNILIYLNEEWKKEWGGALELHGGNQVTTIYPRGGVAVMFKTDEHSWHGHPYPLTCPPDKSRRSLALYYYKQGEVDVSRPTTVYR